LPLPLPITSIGIAFGEGDYVYMPPDVAHLVMNRSGAGATALVAHSALDDQEGIVLLRELDSIV
jgi:uncharacterized RmlC-like cupin family protein